MSSQVLEYTPITKKNKISEVLQKHIINDSIEMDPVDITLHAHILISFRLNKVAPRPSFQHIYEAINSLSQPLPLPCDPGKHSSLLTQTEKLDSSAECA